MATDGKLTWIEMEDSAVEYLLKQRRKEREEKREALLRQFSQEIVGMEEKLVPLKMCADVICRDYGYYYIDLGRKKVRGRWHCCANRAALLRELRAVHGVDIKAQDPRRR